MKNYTMRNVLYFALCITLCAAIGCDEPEQKEQPATPTAPTTPTDPAVPKDPTTPTNPTTPTEPDKPTTPPAVNSDGADHAVTLKSVDVTNGKITLKWESYGDTNSMSDPWKSQEGSTTLLGIKSTMGTTVGYAIFEEIGVDGNNVIILFGEKDYASSGFAKSVHNVVLQEFLLLEGLAEVDDATSNVTAGQTDKNKISYPIYTKWKALEVLTPAAGNANSTLNN